jgi:hypothetical protein
MIFRGTNTSATSVCVVAASGNTVIILAQQSFVGTPKGANIFIGTFYGRRCFNDFRALGCRCLVYRFDLLFVLGAPIMLGFARSSASAGGTVTVAVTGAVDGYTNLKPGALYYARYDGGIDTSSNENNGISTLIVGRATTADTLFSLVRPLGGTLSRWCRVL